MTSIAIATAVDRGTVPRYVKGLTRMGSLNEIRSDSEFSKIEPQLRAAVARACPAWLADQREDLVQTAAARLVQHFRTRDRPVNNSYVWRTAFSVVMDEVRRSRWKTEVEPEGEPASPRHERPDRAARGAEIGRAILDCLQDMVAPRRHAAVLAMAGFSPRETAERMGWNVKRASNLTYRGQADLRDCLTGKGVTP